MPGPKSQPRPADHYDDETRDLRRKAKPNRKAAARLRARREGYAETVRKVNAFDGEFTEPGSQNRNK